jgi:hypothetical protein
MVFKATEIALTRNMIKPEEIPMIKAEFYKRLANKADQIYIGWSAFEILKTSKIDFSGIPAKCLILLRRSYWTAAMTRPFFTRPLQQYDHHLFIPRTSIFLFAILNICY